MLGATMVEVVMIDTAALRASVPVYAVPCAALQTWPLHSAAPSSGCDGRHLHEELSGVLTFRGQRKTGELLRLRATGHLADSQRQNRPPSPRLRRVSKKYATDAITLCQGQQGSNSRSALSAELMNEGASFSLPIGITDAVLGMHGGAADVVRRTS